ncbi:MAG: pantoate--beta-alanine ligase [Pseudomonadota bacterium]
METATTLDQIRARLKDWRAAGERIGLVPTMGALHPGHMSLVDGCRAAAGKVVVSLFINPRQFGPNEDLDAYPRDVESDAAQLDAAGVDLLYAPTLDQVYPEGFATTISPKGPAEGLEDDHRPGFFDGVATVVTKLFLQTGADVATFGEKDYQQLIVVKRFVRDLDVPIEIVAMPTIREEDGLACSSRNAYLDTAQRRIAPRLWQTLSTAAQTIRTTDTPDAIVADAKRDLEACFDEVEYVAWRDGETLMPNPANDRPSRLLAAVRLGTTRLIDNVAVAPGKV